MSNISNDVSKKKINVEGASLEECRTKAVALLGISEHDLIYHVVDYGRKQFFGKKNCKIVAWSAMSEKINSSPRVTDDPIKNIDIDLSIVDMELRHLGDIPETHKEDMYLGQILKNYNDLDEKLKDEIKSLSMIITGAEGKKIQRITSRRGTFIDL